ncbi:hypothetical protein BU15DRAFT_76980 [Melanogaster broomeanus]|nr:hypothetical protein BU15DRAFT_76980 [Melanogaster broomeanus]
MVNIGPLNFALRQDFLRDSVILYKMEVTLPHNAPYQVRRIQNIDIIYSDLQCLAVEGQKMPGAVINAFGAILQQKDDQTADYAILSSYLAPIVTRGTASSGYGTLREHILAACASTSPEELLSRPRWVIPLCGGIPPHWVLTWADLGTHEFGMFDSIPAQHSESWAMPLLRKITQVILDYLGRPDILKDVLSWKRVLTTPSVRQQQIDDWSCGLFTMMAMQTYVMRHSLELVGDDQKHGMRRKVLTLLIDLPIVRETTHTMEPDEHTEPIICDSGFLCRLPNLQSNEPSLPTTPDDSTSLIDKPHGTAKTDIKWDTRRKRRWSASTQSEEDDTDKEDAHHKRSKVASNSGGRASKRTEMERRRQLEEDALCTDVMPHSVRCNGCRNVIKLHPRTLYGDSEWLKHRKKCSQITGVKIVHIRTETVSKAPPKGNALISRFFVKSGMQDQPADAAVMPSPKLDTSNSSSSRASCMTKKINITPPITNFFTKRGAPAPPSACTASATSGSESATSVKSSNICQQIRGNQYSEYIRRTRTRTLGGISPEFQAHAARCLFPYKPFLDLKDVDRSMPVIRAASAEGPEETNENVEERKWTESEKKIFDATLRAFARWEVDYTNERKAAETKLDSEQQHDKLVQREKFTPLSLSSSDARTFNAALQDPLVFDIYQCLNSNDGNNGTDCFLALYRAAKQGKLSKHETFLDICKVFEDKVRRNSSSNPNLKYGVRYNENFRNFMILMRGHGGNSARQYGILQTQIGGPSIRTLRTLVANSEDALSNPELIFENVALGGDCTKVRPRLTYSNDYGSHILGSVLPLNECEVDDGDDIENVIKKIKDAEAIASQVRAIIIKPAIPQTPPLVVALIPTIGKDTAVDIHNQKLILLKMAAQLCLPVVSFAADGAASELAAQSMMDKEASECTPLTYDYPLYGIHLRAPVFKNTGPLVSITDPPHARKTSRNQPQHGTHMASLGVGYVVNHSLVNLYEIHGSGLVSHDVKNVDKQDDGAACRLYAHAALDATCKELEGEPTIRQGFEGLFVWLFIFGTLFEAWLSRSMSTTDRVLAAMRARLWLHLIHQHVLRLTAEFPDLYSTTRSFISPSSFHIFNRLCDSLVLLALAYSNWYPNHPFCPWLLGTEFVEHFFGLARTFLPNFAYAELLKMVQNVMVRQKLLLNSNFREVREKESAAGYSFDYDPYPLTTAHLRKLRANLTSQDLNAIIEVAYREAAQICKDILRIRVPALRDGHPLALAPLGVPIPKLKRSRGSATRSDDPEESESAIDSADESGDDSEEEGYTSSESDPAQAALEVATLSSLCDDLEAGAAEAAAIVTLGPTPSVLAAVRVQSEPSPSPGTSETGHTLVLKSAILDENGKASVALMLKTRLLHESKATVRSERVVQLDPKFTLHKTLSSINKDSKMTVQEASHRVRIAQALDSAFVQAKKARELHWQSATRAIAQLVMPQELPNLQTKNVSKLFPLEHHSVVIVHSTAWFYIGEVLDIYKKGTNNHYGSIDSSECLSNLSFLSLLVYLPLSGETTGLDSAIYEDDDYEDSRPTFTKFHHSYHLHMHAPISNILYHVGKRALIGSNPRALRLTAEATKHWVSLMRPPVKQKLAKLRISAGKVTII